MLGFAGARQVVIFAREDYEFRSHAIVFEGAEPLLALFDRNAIVVVGVQDQRWGFHVARVFQRRRGPVLIESVEQRSFEILFVPVGAIAGSIVTDEIRDAAERNRGLEA